MVVIYWRWIGSSYAFKSPYIRHENNNLGSTDSNIENMYKDSKSF